MACTMWKGVNKHTFGWVTGSIPPILEHSVKSSVPVVAVKQQWQSSGLYFNISEFPPKAPPFAYLIFPLTHCTDS